MGNKHKQASWVVFYSTSYCASPTVLSIDSNIDKSLPLCALQHEADQSQGEAEKTIGLLIYFLMYCLFQKELKEACKDS